MKSILATIGAGILVLGVWIIFEKLGEWFLRSVGENNDSDDPEYKILAFLFGLLFFFVAAAVIILLYIIGDKVILPGWNRI